MDIRQLRYFLAVVDTGSVHRAAEQLFVAQPSVSQAIRRLETDLGSELFRRQGRGLVLSTAGHALVGPARDAVRGVEIARDAVAAVEGLRGGQLTLVSMPSQVVRPLTPLVATFTERHPGVAVAVAAAARPDDVRETLRRGSAELGVVAAAASRRDPSADVGSLSAEARLADLDHLFLERQSFVLVDRDDGTAPERSPTGLSVADLHDLSIIAGQRGTGMRRVADDIVSSGQGCRIIVEIEHREALLPLVQQGVGVAVVAESWRPLAEAVGLRVRRLDIDDCLDVGLVWPRRRLSAAATAFVELAAGARRREDR